MLKLSTTHRLIRCKNGWNIIKLPPICRQRLLDFVQQFLELKAIPSKIFIYGLFDRVKAGTISKEMKSLSMKPNKKDILSNHIFNRLKNKSQSQRDEKQISLDTVQQKYHRKKLLLSWHSLLFER